jgi:ferritin-like metal-binding protein YciE
MAEAARLLDETLREESQTDEDLNMLANKKINATAMGKAA